MKLKQLAVILLCFTMLLAVLAGCGTPEEPPDNGNTQETPGITEPGGDPHENNHTHTPDIDFDAAFSAFPPDTVMIKAGDYVVTWEELYVFLFRSVNSVEQLLQTGIGWSDIYAEEKTLAEITLEYSTDEALLFRVYEHGAKVSGISMSASDYEALQDDLDYLTEMYGGREEFAQSLKEYSGFSSLELFEKLLGIEYLIGIIVNELYGEDGILFPDESVAYLVERENLLMAQHILRTKKEDGDDTPLKESEDLLQQLDNYNGDDFGTFFYQLMLENSEDPGSLHSPGGYLFQPWDMVEEFSNACISLEIGQYSGIVETSYGYHILLRLPVDYDAVPVGLANTGQSRTLRQIAAVENFEFVVIQGWRDDLTVEYTPEYLSINIEAIFS